MKTFLIQLVFAWITLVVVHIAAMSAMAMLFGVRLRQVSFGFGKKLVMHGLLTIRAVPLGGYVRFKNTGDYEYADVDSVGAFNHKSKLVQALIPLAGSGALLLIAMLIQPTTAIAELLEGFRQIVVGAFAPGSTAQQNIDATYTLAARAGFVGLVGLLAAKFAAFNLLPFPWTNGGQALLALLRADGTRTPAWQERIVPIAMWPFVAIVGSWAFGFAFFIVSKT